MVTEVLGATDQQGIDGTRKTPRPKAGSWDWLPLLGLIPLLVIAAVLIRNGYTNSDFLTGDLMDLDGYRLAGERFAAGESIYADPTPDRTRADYRHAPWLAWLWAGLNLLPDPVLLWRLLTLVGVGYILVALVRLGGAAGVLLAATALPLIGAIPHANVGILMIALLMWRRADPISVGIAGSLKIYPLLLVFGYIAERRWRDVAISLGIAGLLWLPALWSGIGDWPALPGDRGTFSGVLLPIIGLAGVGVLGWLAYRRSRWTWLAVGAALPLGIPHHVGVEYVWVAARLTPIRTRSDRRYSRWPPRSTGRRS